MSDQDGLYTDRMNSPKPRNIEKLPEATEAGLRSLIERRVTSNWLAQEFPEFCDDGDGIVGTDLRAFGLEISAIVDGLTAPLWQGKLSDDQLFDIIEYVGERVAKPSDGAWHPRFRHFELKFDPGEGRADFAASVNQILARGGTVFELTPQMKVRRIGSPEVRAALSSLRPDSGDPDLDELVEQGRQLYRSRDATERSTGIEKLWDAYERLKELDAPGDKKAGVVSLLSHVADPTFRVVVEAEMRALTALGNDFRIRHHEPSKKAIPPDARDYAAARMANLLTFLLAQSGRLSHR